MSWTVVEFLETEEVEAVPTKWLLHKQCYWPPLEAQKVVAEIKKCGEPNTCWPLYDIRIFKNGTFDDYMLARNKSKRAEATSELASEEDGTRKRKKNPILLSSDESEESVLPPPPRFKKVRKLNIRNDCSRQKYGGERDGYSSVNNKIVLQQVVDGQKSLRAQVLQLRDEIKNSTSTINNDSTKSSFFDNLNCPIQEQEELNTIEEYLEAPENVKKAVYELSRLGGRNIYDCVKRILTNLMKNSLAQDFSYHRAKGKKPFKLLKVNSIIIESLSRRQDFNKKEIEVSTMKWLKRAKERK